jgi:hypothetical protein
MWPADLPRGQRRRTAPSKERRKMTGRVLRRLSGTTVALTLLATAASAQERTFEWSGRLTDGQTLEVKGITGNIRAELASGSTAEVMVRKRGDRDDFDQVRILVDEGGDGVTVCAVYGDHNFARSSCDYNDDGGDRDEGRRHNSIDVDVEFVVRVPAGVDFAGTMVTGDVWAEGLRSDVTVRSVTGDVRVSTTGIARANTVTGEIDVEIGRMDWDHLSFKTVTGDITLRVPADFDADVDFASLSGDLDSDFDIQVTRERRRWIGSQVRGTIGRGGRDLELNTVSGDVRLLRAG